MKSLFTFETEVQIRTSLRARREHCIQGWLMAWNADAHYRSREDDLEFWTREIRAINDALVEVVRITCPEILS